MSRKKAEYELKKLLITGYSHYSREEERRLMNEILGGNGLETLVLRDEGLPLASQPTRHIKNAMICLIAVTCRHAADLGADDKRCYALGDYYINEVEQTNHFDNVIPMVTEIFQHYIDLVRESRLKEYSLPIRHAIQYIEQNLYEKCSLQDVSKKVNLNPNYLSAKFKSEVGIVITDYIIDRKMKEAKNLLSNSSYSVSEISEMLGYNSLSYFARLFKRKYLVSPGKYRQQYTGNM